MLLKDPRCIVGERPFQQIIDIPEVIIKGLSADLCQLRDLSNGDFINGIPRQQLLQRRGQHMLGLIWHGFSLPLC